MYDIITNDTIRAWGRDPSIKYPPLLMKKISLPTLVNKFSVVEY